MPQTHLAVVVAHADDAEIWAGGTLLRHRDAGGHLTIHYLNFEDAGRRDEALRVGSLLGADVSFPNCRADLLRELASCRPDALITHWLRDSHSHHRRTAEAVCAIFPKLAITHATWPRVFACDTYNSLGREPGQTFVPTDLVDVTEVWDRKIALITEYATQPAAHFIAMAESQGRLHGARSGVTFAEAFRELPMLGVMRRARRLLIEA